MIMNNTCLDTEVIYFKNLNICNDFPPYVFVGGWDCSIFYDFLPYVFAGRWDCSSC